VVGGKLGTTHAAVFKSVHKGSSLCGVETQASYPILPDQLKVRRCHIHYDSDIYDITGATVSEWRFKPRLRQTDKSLFLLNS